MTQITATVNSQPITATVNSSGNISASVGSAVVTASAGGGIGPQGPAGSVAPLESVTDVAISSVADGDVLRYQTNKWRNFKEIDLTIDGGNF